MTIRATSRWIRYWGRSRRPALAAGFILAATAACCATSALAEEPPSLAPTPQLAPSASPETDAERLHRLEQRFEDLERRYSAQQGQLERAQAAAATVLPVTARGSTGSAALEDPVAAEGPERVILGPDWTSGFTLRDKAGRFRLRVGGIVQVDGRFFPANTAPGPVDQFLIRSARVEVDATVWRYVDARINADFGQGRVQLQEAYTDIKLFPQLRIRGGKFKVPFSLERLQLEGRTAFMERSFVTSISPNRDVGAMIFGEIAEGALQYQVGVVNGVVENSTLDLETDDDKEGALRLFVQPLKRTRWQAVHDLGIGGAVTYGRAGGTVANPGVLSIRTDGLTDAFKLPAGATSEATTLAAGRRVRGAAQAFYYAWRVGLMAEYVYNWQELRRGPAAAGVALQAWQAYATLLLTPDRASYAGVKPARPLELAPGGERGTGAWQIGFRYSGLRVDDRAFSTAPPLADAARSPRSAASYTFDVSWLPNANARLQLEYARTEFSGGASVNTAGVVMPTDRAPENALMGRIQWML